MDKFITMKRCLTLIFLIIISCNNRRDYNAYLTDDNAKIWYVESTDRDSFNNGYTLWYFNNDNDFLRYSYNSKTKILELLDNGDKIDSNKFILTGEDSISLNNSKLPILKLSKDEFILEDINSDSSIPSDTIFLKIYKMDNKIFTESYGRLLNRIDSLNSNIDKIL